MFLVVGMDVRDQLHACISYQDGSVLGLVDMVSVCSHHCSNPDVHLLDDCDSNFDSVVEHNVHGYHHHHSQRSLAVGNTPDKHHCDTVPSVHRLRREFGLMGWKMESARFFRHTKPLASKQCFGFLLRSSPCFELCALLPFLSMQPSALCTSPSHLSRVQCGETVLLAERSSTFAQVLVIFLYFSTQDFAP